MTDHPLFIARCLDCGEQIQRNGNHEETHHCTKEN